MNFLIVEDKIRGLIWGGLERAFRLNCLLHGGHDPEPHTIYKGHIRMLARCRHCGQDITLFDGQWF